MIQHNNEPHEHRQDDQHPDGHEHDENGQDEEGRQHHHDKVEVTVNGRPVILHGKHASGAQIKAAAIEQGVAIQQNFVLQEELPNGTSVIIGDADEVHLRPHLKFTAIRHDDNS